MEQIKTFEDACAVLKLSPALPEVSTLAERHQKAIIAQYKLFIIAEALNQKGGKLWVPDWTNYDEYKYQPYFNMDESPSGGFGFCHSYRWRTYSGVGSRLVYRTRKLSDYAANQFIELYRDWMMV